MPTFGWIKSPGNNQSPSVDLLSILRTRTEEARRRASAAVREWQKTADAAYAEWQKTAEAADATLRTVCVDHHEGGTAPHDFPTEMAAGIPDLKRRAADADYLTALGIAEVANAKRQHIIEVANAKRQRIVEYLSKELKETIGRREKRAAEIRRQIEGIVAEQKRQIREAENEASYKRSSIKSEEMPEELSSSQSIAVILGFTMFVFMLIGLSQYLNFFFNFIVSAVICYLLVLIAYSYIQGAFEEGKKRRIAQVDQSCAEQVAKSRIEQEKQLGTPSAQLQEIEGRISLAKKSLAEITP
jgi:VIT1/CCC1 family predicted Fe2+/Mn2+ transporter